MFVLRRIGVFIRMFICLVMLVLPSVCNVRKMHMMHAYMQILEKSCVVSFVFASLLKCLLVCLKEMPKQKNGCSNSREKSLPNLDDESLFNEEEFTVDKFIDNSFKKWKWLSQAEFQRFQQDTIRSIVSLKRRVLQDAQKKEIHELTMRETQSKNYKSLKHKKAMSKSEVKLFENANKQLQAEYEQTSTAVCVVLQHNKNGKYKARLKYQYDDANIQHVTEDAAFSWVKKNVGVEWIAYLQYMTGKERRCMCQFLIV